jgi:hypothetical protein
LTDILHRVELHEPEQARAVLARNMLPWLGEQLKQGRELVLEARLLDDDITAKQRGYLHAVVLTEIAQKLHPGGQRFPMQTWKEHYRAKFLGFDVVSYIDPFTGKKLRRRVRKSTEDLGVRGMADYIDQIMADVAEYGITISEPLPPELRPGKRKPAPREHIDADGVITLETST